MKLKTTETIEITLSLTVEEAIQLKLLVQNACSEYEPKETTDFREKLWDCLPPPEVLYAKKGQ